MIINKQLIIDVGMRVVKNTEFYLEKGFNVVNIEANLAFVRQARFCPKEYLLTCGLIIFKATIVRYISEVDSYINV